MKFLCLLHAPYEKPGYVSDYIKKRKHSLSFVRVFNNEIFPSFNSFDVLLIMGGSMGVNDDEKYPWLKQEKKFIEDVIKCNKKIIGICLGSQLLANVLGARVYPNQEKEIGFFPVVKKSNNYLVKEFPDTFNVFHWHGDTFDLPLDSELLASSEACTNQAFIYKNQVLGLQFHIEVTAPLVSEFLKYGKNELLEARYVQNKDKIKDGFKHINQCNVLLEDLLKKFLNDA